MSPRMRAREQGTPSLALSQVYAALTDRVNAARKDFALAESNATGRHPERFTPESVGHAAVALAQAAARLAEAVACLDAAKEA